MDINRFNIRVYGIYVNLNKEVLLSTEWINKKVYTKFPGGGLEFGEGTKDGLKREFQEEMNGSIKILEHLYTTDKFVQSAFKKEDQLISIYYTVDIEDPASIEFLSPKDPKFLLEGRQHAFHLKPINKLSAEDLSFPVDRHILPLIKKML